jgi:hypothetical protein
LNQLFREVNVLVKEERLEKPLTVDELIRETRRCRQQVQLSLKAGIAVQTITSYQPQEFLRQLWRFRRFMQRIRRIQRSTKRKHEVPKWRNEELLLMLEIGKTHIEFRKPPSNRLR